MRRLVLSLLLLGLSMAPAAWAQEDESPAPSAALPAPAIARRQIAGCYARMDAALGRKDAAETVSYLDPNFMEIDTHGKRHSEWQEEESTTTALGIVRTIHSTTRLQSLTRQGDGYVAQITQQFVLTGYLASGGTAWIVGAAVQRDFWIHDEDGWHIKRSRILSDHATLNGRPYHPRPHA